MMVRKTKERDDEAQAHILDKWLNIPIFSHLRPGIRGPGSSNYSCILLGHSKHICIGSHLFQKPPEKKKIFKSFRNFQENPSSKQPSSYIKF